MLPVTTNHPMPGTLLEDARKIRVPGMGASLANDRCTVGGNTVGSVHAQGAIDARWLNTDTPDFAKNYHSQRWRLTT